MELIIDALIDSVKLLPFLFLVYLLIGYLESSTDNGLYRKLVEVKWLGPIIGSLLGCLPQCGFSVVGANLYSRRMISLGTLLAIFISTSDEAIPILFAHPGMLKSVAIVLGLKLVIAMLVGLVIEAVMTMLGKKEALVSPIAASEKLDVQQSCSCQSGCHDHGSGVWRNALLHTVKVFVYILVINLALNAIIEGIGEDSLSSILLSNSMWQPVLAALIGLIPNCAASIIITEMYITGTLSLGALIAGLITGAGMGLMILFRANKPFAQNFKILGILYATGVIFGMLLQMIS